jgi:hypothetical protein
MLTGTQAMRAQEKKAGSKPEAETIDPVPLPVSLPNVAMLLPKEGMQAVEKNGRYGFEAVGGEVVISCKYEDVDWFSGGLAAVKLNGKWGFIDRKDRPVIPFKYELASSFSEGLAPVKLHGKWGFINIKDEVAIPFQYEDILWSFEEGLVPVRLHGKSGYIDANGKTVIPFRYDDAYGFKDGKARVTLGRRDFYIDRRGHEVKE